MRILLDTHIFLWLITGSNKLSNEILAILADRSNTLYLSPLSVWEVLINRRLMDDLPPDVEGYLAEQREKHEIASLDLTEDSVFRLAGLPTIHKDPFDRMLICQAIHHNLKIATSDANIIQYPVDVLANVY